MRSKQYFTSIKNNPHEISTDPNLFLNYNGLSILGIQEIFRMNLFSAIK